MRNRLRYILITFLIVTLAGLGSALAGVRLCSYDCVLYAAPAAAVSCCDDGLSVDHGNMVSVKPAEKFSAVDCPHGELCAAMNYPTDAGINSSNLFDDGALPANAPAFLEQSLVTYLQPVFLPHPPPEDAFPPLYTRNCSYLI